MKYQLYKIAILVIFVSPNLILPADFNYLDNSIYYDYLDYQINSGQLEQQYVLTQFRSYRSGLFEKMIMDTTNESNAMEGAFKTGYQLNTKGYNNAYFYLEEYYHGKHVEFGNITGINRDYKNDPEFAGDLSEADSWLYGRIEEAFIDIRYNQFNAFLGRKKRNWGPINSRSLILSDHPYSYDHLYLSYTSEKQFRLSLIYAPLDTRTAQSFRYPDSLLTDVNRYVVGHRLDINFSKRFQIGLTEMAIYGGPDRSPEFSYFNPLTFYYPTQRNDRKPMSGLWSVDAFYKPVKKITLYGQFLIDDIIVNNEPDTDDRDQYDDRFGLLLSFRTGDIIQGLNTDVTYNRVWSRTYQSKNTWENYHYRGLGLGYPRASSEEVKIKLSYWDLLPFILSTEFIAGRYGNVHLTDIFPFEKEPFPVPPVHNNYIFNLDITYFGINNLRLSTNLRYIHNAEHYSVRINPHKGFTFKLGIDYTFRYGFDSFALE